MSFNILGFIIKLISYLLYPFQLMEMKKVKTIDLTPENAFDEEYKAEMQAKGYTINDSAHARIILDDIQTNNLDMLNLVRNAAKDSLQSDSYIESVTITNKSRTFKEIVLR